MVTAGGNPWFDKYAETSLYVYVLALSNHTYKEILNLIMQ
jgi:hypothetical protein